MPSLSLPACVATALQASSCPCRPTPLGLYVQPTKHHQPPHTPQAIPNALKVQQAAISKLQRAVRLELAKLQSEEVILKLMIKREKQRLQGQQQGASKQPQPQQIQPTGALGLG